MTAGATLGPYTFYSGTYAISQLTGAKFGVSSGAFADSFKNVTALTASCAAGPPLAPKVLEHKAVVGLYNFKGCYTEGTGVRALSDKSTSNNTMTSEFCASYCTGYNYFGIEYGSECVHQKPMRIYRADIRRLLWKYSCFYLNSGCTVRLLLCLRRRQLRVLW